MILLDFMCSVLGGTPSPHATNRSSVLFICRTESSQDCVRFVLSFIVDFFLKMTSCSVLQIGLETKCTENKIGSKWKC